VTSALPQDQERTITRWTGAAIVATLRDALHTDALSRSSIWRILHDIALTPYKSASWLNSHDADCEAKAHILCQLDAKALASYPQGRRVSCCDEKTGRQVLERKAPTQPAQPGRRERREHEDIRHGTCVLITSLAVAPGPMACTIGRTRTATDFVTHLHQPYHRLPRMTHYDWGLDNLHTPWSLDVCRVVARWGKVPCEPHKLKKGAHRRAFVSDPRHRHVLHGTPQHGSWLKQAELCFGVLHHRFLARGSFPSAKAFERRLERFVQDDNARHAPPYAGPTRGSHECAPRRSVAHGANNARDGLG
jgi:hypothetical protein